MQRKGVDNVHQHTKHPLARQPVKPIRSTHRPVYRFVFDCV